MALRNGYGFHEYTYLDPEYTYLDSEYIIRPMNTKRAQCTCYTQLVIKPYILVFLLQAARTITLPF